MDKHSPKREISIKWKVFSYLVGFCVLLLLILWLFQTVFLDSFYRQIRLFSLQSDMRSLSETIENSDIADLWNPRDAYQIEFSETLKLLHRQVADRGDIQVELFSPNVGSVVITGDDWEGVPTTGLFGSGTNSQYTAREKLAFAAEAQKAGAPIVHITEASSFDAGYTREYALCATLVPTEGEILLLLCNTNLTPVNAAADTLRIQLVCISLLTLLLAVVIALLIARRVSRPIERINAAAKELGQGHYDVGFRGTGYREIAELADTLQKASEELGKTDRLRRELIANVSHDLRTPLTLITGYGEMMRDLPDENTSENMQVIINEATRLTNLVTELLDISRLEAGTVEMRMIPFCITDDIRAVIERFEKFCSEQGCTIRFAYTEPVVVTADPDRIMQVVYNYIQNAIIHSGTDKLVTVTQTIADQRVTISVADTGPGIDEEDLPYIWNRYYKGRAEQSSCVGNGLGLSIVRSILSLHPNSRHGVFSAPGEGSTFWFSLPLQHG